MKAVHPHCSISSTFLHIHSRPLFSFFPSFLVQLFPKRVHPRGQTVLSPPYHPVQPTSRHFPMPACRCHNSLSSPHEPCHCLWCAELCLYHVWQRVLPQQPCCHWAQTPCGTRFADDACSTEASRGCRRRQGESVWCAASLPRDCFNVSTCQAAICHTLRSHSITGPGLPDGITYASGRHTVWQRKSLESWEDL